jgi:molybdenum cofactor cytidylyltransferase
MIAGIILAAGRSSRLGRPKQLLPLAGEPIIRHTVRRVLASTLDEVVVVIGDDADAVRDALEGLPVRLVVNPRAAEGQSTSVVTGISSLLEASETEPERETEAVVILLGDQPTIDPTVIDAVIQQWRESNSPVAAARYRDILGSPVLFASPLFPELLRLQGDIGAREIVRAKRDTGELATVTIDRPAPQDVDTDEDYQRLLESFPPPIVSRQQAPLPAHRERGWGGGH